MDLSHTLKKLYLPKAILRIPRQEYNSIVMVVVGYG